MKTTLVVLVLVLASLAYASPGPAATTPRAPAAASVVAQLRHAIRWHRARTWYWQDRAGVARTESRFAERRTTSEPFLRWVARLWGQRRVAAHRRYETSARRLASSGASVPATICRVFGAARCSTAKAIAWRESRYELHPCCNSTHFGLFQLDASALRAYSRGRYSTVLDQVMAAWRMYLARGWEPWTCCE